MTEDVPASRQSAVTVTTVTSGNLSNGLSGSNAGENGYVTENQRFLHVQIQNNDANETLTLYAYNYAFARWGKFYIPVGVKDSADTTAELAYVPATFSSIDGTKQVVVPLQGIDRVAFVDDGSHDVHLIVRAACSTF